MPWTASSLKCAEKTDGEEIFPSVFPSLGMTLIFLICAVLAMFTGKKMNPLRTVYDAVNSALPVMGILMGVGMFIQIMTATGVKGYIVISSVSLPTVLLYVAIALLIPLLGSSCTIVGATGLAEPIEGYVINWVHPRPACTLFDQQRSDDRRLCDCVDCQRRRIDAAYGTRGHVCGECCR